MLEYLRICLECLFIGSFGIQLWYYGWVFSKIYQHKAHPSSEHLDFPSLSLVICARNELKNLQQHLSLWLAQDYPNDWELLIINDASTDKSADWLRAQIPKNPRLRLIDLPKKQAQGKKEALLQGFLAAQNDWIVLTDADCTPVSKHWLKNLLSARQAQTRIILGYSPYLPQNSWLNLYIRYETVWAGMQYLGLGLAGFPYMGVGRNLAYERNFVLKHQNLAQHAAIASGDDDLLVNGIATAQNTAFSFAQDSHTLSSPKDSWKDWYAQKKRHFSTGSHYKLRDKILLGGLIQSQIWFYLSIILLYFCGGIPNWVWGMFGIRFLRMAWVWQRVLQVLSEKSLIRYFWGFDILSLLFYPIFASALINKPAKKQSWK
jgi:glycosyltransferase involved in cell wall biosynthesis